MIALDLSTTISISGRNGSVDFGPDLDAKIDELSVQASDDVAIGGMPQQPRQLGAPAAPWPTLSMTGSFLESARPQIEKCFSALDVGGSGDQAQLIGVYTITDGSVEITATLTSPPRITEIRTSVQAAYRFAASFRVEQVSYLAAKRIVTVAPIYGSASSSASLVYPSNAIEYAWPKISASLSHWSDEVVLRRTSDNDRGSFEAPFFDFNDVRFQPLPSPVSTQDRVYATTGTGTRVGAQSYPVLDSRRRPYLFATFPWQILPLAPGTTLTLRPSATVVTSYPSNKSFGSTTGWSVTAGSATLSVGTPPWPGPPTSALRVVVGSSGYAEVRPTTNFTVPQGFPPYVIVSAILSDPKIQLGLIRDPGTGSEQRSWRVTIGALERRATLIWPLGTASTLAIVFAFTAPGTYYVGWPGLGGSTRSDQLLPDMENGSPSVVMTLTTAGTI